ncbi:MAG TPA: adenylosuccinate synthase [Anaerolinea thermolimosa]|uniref:Adenylosuccinate synthetase n=1 Tax=Anaerolinea thermolimosa TaxID=229919 RepID=A0A3D1JF69_9CHLR|nr:adenylosuccinate synthase [Anaerolinea thermolimosa]
MPLDIVVGTQWGDEGKGRVVDLLSSRADIVARYNGGDNAGHTVTVGKQTFKLHLIPSGIIHPRTTGVLGNGVVIYPPTLLTEIDMLRNNQVEINPQRLRISHAAHLITPAHRALDRAQETARGREQIGTTGRGIGPAYTDKAARRGIRMEEMLDETAFHRRMIEHVEEANQFLTTIYHAEALDPLQIADEYTRAASVLREYITDTSALLWEALQRGQLVLAEGAQGTLLDLDHGTYPFVTSSSPTAPGVLPGLGIGFGYVNRVIGVTKAFQTRVGAGPFPTEVFGETATRLRGTGANPWDEFGTTTGRPRRVGWLDGVLLRYAVRINGLTELVVTKLDVLSGLPEIRICTAYRINGQEYTDLPLGPADLSPFEPVYEEMPGWGGDISGARTWNDLPEEAQNYLTRISQISGVPVCQVSVGPEREQVVDAQCA